MPGSGLFLTFLFCAAELWHGTNKALLWSQSNTCCVNRDIKRERYDLSSAAAPSPTFISPTPVCLSPSPPTQRSEEKPEDGVKVEPTDNKPHTSSTEAK